MGEILNICQLVGRQAVIDGDNGLLDILGIAGQVCTTCTTYCGGGGGGDFQICANFGSETGCD